MSAKIMKMSDKNDLSNEEEMDLDLEDLNHGNGSDSDEAVDAVTNESGTDTTGANARNTSWADAMNKVLSVKTKNKSFILSKAKKDREMKRRSDDQNDGIELVGSDGRTVGTNTDNNKKSKPNESKEKKRKKKIKLSKKEWEVMHKLKPKTEDRDRERQLCAIATKGVVQLFNAVREQQKTIESKLSEVGSSETKRDKMLTQFSKNRFLDKLKRKDGSNKEKTVEKKGSEEQKWKVLRDDFMIGAKMKDWDKQSDTDEQSNQ